MGIINSPSRNTPTPKSQPQQLLNPLPRIQRIRLLPQNVRSEIPKRRLDPLPALCIPSDSLPSGRTARQNANLTANKEASETEKGVSGDVAEGGWSHEGRHIGYCFFKERRKATRQHHRHTNTQNARLQGKSTHLPSHPQT